MLFDNNKFEKIVELVDGVIQEPDITAPEMEEVEPAAEADVQDKHSSADAGSGLPTSDVRPGGSSPVESGVVNSPAMPDTKEDIRQTVAGGLQALGKIADMLRTPESTQALVDAIVKEDPDTVQTSLNIPVLDKSTVVNLLSALSAFFNR